MSSPCLVILSLCYHTIAVAGRRVHIHRLWPLRGTSDGRDSNRRQADEHVVYKTSFILVYTRYFINMSNRNTERSSPMTIASAEWWRLVNSGRRGGRRQVVAVVHGFTWLYFVVLWSGRQFFCDRECVT